MDIQIDSLQNFPLPPQVFLSGKLTKFKVLINQYEIVINFGPNSHREILDNNWNPFWKHWLQMPLKVVVHRWKI